jgi:uncharacterized protein YcbX
VTASLAQIRLYPVKALDPAVVSAARIAAGGALAFDRRWALFDDQGQVLNGKNEARVHGVRSRYEIGADGVRVAVSAPGMEDAAFDLGLEGAAFAAWMGRAVGRPLELREHAGVGFPDDLESYGPTVVSTASLEAVASWFPGLTTDSVRRRFRANLEITGVEPWWEDRLYAGKGEGVRFRVGDVLLDGTNPCARCVVPPRDPDTGAALPLFQKTFAERRRQALPAWAETTRFNHFYRFTVNTVVPLPEAGKHVRVGDAVTID